MLQELFEYFESWQFLSIEGGFNCFNHQKSFRDKFGEEGA
jgi:hypothetical protein